MKYPVFRRYIFFTLLQFAIIQASIGQTVKPPRADSDQRASQLMAQMTQEEKIQLVHGAGGVVPRGSAGWVQGIPRLGIPNLYLTDGSIGVGNNVGPAVALPSSIASAAGWDMDEAYKYGNVIGVEMRAYGVNVNLGGNVNLGREPRNGRTFETKGEDPILAGKIAAMHIRAIQDQHILGGIKHFALNDQETIRATVNVQIDERSARETDLLAFEIGIKDSNVQSVMCSYNLVNTIYACENSHLLNDILKGDWGFKGFVMSDWSATHSTVAAALAGLDQEEPTNTFFRLLPQGLATGQLPQSRLDDMVHRILRAMFETGIFDYPMSNERFDFGTDSAIAQEVEEQGAVLLRNENTQLPLDPARINSIAVIGSHADVAVLSGGGSAHVIPIGGPALTEGYPSPPSWAQVIWIDSSPLQAIRAKAPAASVRFDGGTNQQDAAALAAACDVAIVFVSQWESEDMDVPALTLTDVIHKTPIDQNALVEAIAAANPHTIVVIESGGAHALPWLRDVNAVLESWYPGQRGGEAIANILFGTVTPSGKLPMTFPSSVADLPHPVIPSVPRSTVNYNEGLNVGYKWYDAKHITPLFPFGFGLSYTTFAIANATVTNNLAADYPGFIVTFDVTNTGSMAGAEVAQIYVGMPPSTGEPPKRLVGWKKVFLQPGEKQQFAIEVDANDSSHPLSYWDVDLKNWVISPGDYTVMIGNSADNASLKLAGVVHK